MRAVEVTRFGAPEVLVTVRAPDPVPGDGEVVIDVEAVDTLWVETMIRSGGAGDFFPIRPPYRPGAGVGGTVAVIGSGVGPMLLGARVIAPTREHGGYAEKALVPASDLVVVPDGLAVREATALLHDGTTALGIADLVAIKPGDRVLITAAAGGAGAILTQLAKDAGATVVAAARGSVKRDRAARLGADVTVDYAEPDWIERVRDATGGLDVLLDGAGGDLGRAAFALVMPGGRVCAYGAPAGGFAAPDPAAAEAREITVSGIGDLQFEPGRFSGYASRALELAAAGRIKPLIGQTFPLDRAADAHRMIEQRAALGKTLLIP